MSMSFSIDTILGKGSQKRDYKQGDSRKVDSANAHCSQADNIKSLFCGRSVSSASSSPDLEQQEQCTLIDENGDSKYDIPHALAPKMYGILPRPGLLNIQPTLIGTNQSYTLSGIVPPSSHLSCAGRHIQSAGVGVESQITAFGSSAFHTPSDQAMKIAQAQAQMQHMDWIARNGICISRMVDFNGEYIYRHFCDCFGDIF